MEFEIFYKNSKMEFNDLIYVGLSEFHIHGKKKVN